MVADEVVLDRYGGGEEARNAFQLVADVYAEALTGAEPVKLPEHHGGRAERTETPGFVLVLARVGAEVVGFAYGYPNDDDVLELSELTVRDQWRDKGIEDLLRDALLEPR